MNQIEAGKAARQIPFNFDVSLPEAVFRGLRARVDKQIRRVRLGNMQGSLREILRSELGIHR